MGIAKQVGKVYTTSPQKCWKFVIKDGAVRDNGLWEGEGITQCIYPIFASDPTEGKGAISSEAAKQQCLDYIAANKLAYEPKKDRAALLKASAKKK